MKWFNQVSLLVARGSGYEKHFYFLLSTAASFANGGWMWCECEEQHKEKRYESI